MMNCGIHQGTVFGLYPPMFQARRLFNFRNGNDKVTISLQTNTNNSHKLHHGTEMKQRYSYSP